LSTYLFIGFAIACFHFFSPLVFKTQESWLWWFERRSKGFVDTCIAFLSAGIIWATMLLAWPLWLAICGVILWTAWQQKRDHQRLAQSLARSRGMATVIEEGDEG